MPTWQQMVVRFVMATGAAWLAMGERPPLGLSGPTAVCLAVMMACIIDDGVGQMTRR